ncbi:TPA: AraC family transcriptional regulator ligand-binding domain-containing protein [Pseudomonas aeruginosa]|nr:AraC family transcriptional regulator ligand-binding domain-containing protein [Pseudomonas aeruginosa]HBN9551979.1 AraC family transcriptional regulator ligand-binding domain-containing protein [Pseudomonas aeruginosa]
MIDSTFSRATWLNSLHMSTLTLSLLEKEGFAREQLLEGSGITPADLLDLRRLISPWQEQQVFANACRLSDEPALGLRLGLRTRISAYGLLGYALLSAPTLGEALRIGLSYPVLLGTYFHLSLEVADGRAWLDKVRAILAERLQDPPGLEELARRLNCSSRSLRRHLQQQRTSYQQLLDELRFARAKELLQSGDMPIYRIAEELGFSETASLRHAFQRWSGQPPSHFRA